MVADKRKKQVVVIGGGTGTQAALRGLKRYTDEVDITAIISMADSGGSTGRLRDEFGYLPVGDVRMALTALSRDYDEHEELLRELFLYRFDKGEGLTGHNFGNLLLVALTDILGSEAAAVRAAGRMLRIKGQVLPVTETALDIVATYSDGTVVVGEHQIDEPAPPLKDLRITTLASSTEAVLSADADTAIAGADLIVWGPGDLYSSLLANAVVRGMPEAIQAASGRLVYVSNLMSRPGQTRGMSALDHQSEIARYLGRTPDSMILNTAALPEPLLARYAKEGDLPVADDCPASPGYIRTDLLGSEQVVTKTGDVLQRSLIRHDPAKLAQVLYKLLE